MLIPWPLVASVAVAVAVGAAVLRWRGQPIGAGLDVAAAVALPAVIGARLAGWTLDALALGAIPDPRGLLSLGTGLSVAAGVLSGAGGWWWETRRRPRGAALRDAVLVAGAAGLAAWSIMALVRGDAGGVAAPLPVGLPMPGFDEPRLPVFAIDAGVWVATAVWLLTRGRHLPLPRRAAAVGLVAAGSAAVGPALRPSLPTLDRDVEAVLALVAVLIMGALVAGVPVLARRIATGAAVLVVVVAVALVTDGPAGPPPATADGAAGSVDGAAVAGGDAGPVAAWDGADLAAHVREADLPVVVNLWASWCPPCHAEAPALARAARALEGHAVVVGVIVDDSAEDARAFVDRYALPFPSVLDDGAAASVGHVGLPTTVVLRSDGTEAHRLVGGVDAAALAAAVQRAS